MIQIEKAIQTINKKIVFIILSTAIFTFLILIRLFYLQIYCNYNFLEQSKKNFTRTKITKSPRGNITDRNGNLLATNRPLVNLYWQGSGKRFLNKNQNNELKKIFKILEIKNPELENKIKIAERLSQKILLYSDVPFSILSKISESFSNHPNIKLENSFKRFYPYNNSACHILGYLSQENIEYIGKTGLEYVLDNLLKGENGKIISTINSRGKQISEKEIIKSNTGQTIQTCIDIKLQKIAEECFPSEKSGSIIIIDPFNGELKALLSVPTFDPNKFLQSISYENWQELQKNNAFLNRTCNASYPPASLFKLVTLIAALEEKIIDFSTMTECKGFTHFVDRKYHCANRMGHGKLSVKEAFAKSCNILFYNIGKNIHIDTIAKYANQLGLGLPTGILITEKTGLIPTNAWKKDKLKERWWQGETLSASIGQSFILVTPMQIARMMGGIFTGYLVKPKILTLEETIKEELDINPQNLKFMQNLLKKVVKSGTGKQIKNIEDIKVYAKTGTAQTSSFSKRKLGKQFLEHAWFVSYFQYKDHKPMVMVIMIENAGNTRPALNTAKKILLKYKNLKQ